MERGVREGTSKITLASPLEKNSDSSVVESK